MDAQPRYIKVTQLGVTRLIPKSDPRVKARYRRNHGGAKRLSYYATINGAGLKNIALLNRIANKRHGKHIVSENLSEYVEDALCVLLAHPFRNSKHVSPDLSRKEERDRGKIGRDYSAFPKQKKSKAAYKAAKKRRIVVATPRQSPWVVPEKYRALNPQTPPAVTAAPVRLNLKPVEGK